VVTSLRRELHSNLNLVAADGPQRELTCQ